MPDRIVRRAARLADDGKLGRSQQEQVRVLCKEPEQRQDEEGGGRCCEQQIEDRRSKIRFAAFVEDVASDP